MINKHHDTGPFCDIEGVSIDTSSDNHYGEGVILIAGRTNQGLQVCNSYYYPFIETWNLTVQPAQRLRQMNFDFQMISDAGTGQVVDITTARFP